MAFPGFRHAVAALLLLALPLVCRAFSEEQPASRKLLVVLDDFSVKASHSLFFASLKDRGYSLDFRKSTDKSVILQKYGKYLYDGAVLFSPAAGLGNMPTSLDVASLVDFVDSGHDVIMATEDDTSDIMRDFATECGVDIDETTDAVVIDHQNFVEADIDADHALVAAAEIVNSTVMVGSEAYEGPVVYRGVGLTVTPSDLVVPVLSASESAFAANPLSRITTVPALHGKSIALVAAMQARNNARVLISGSLDLFSDLFFNMKVEYKGETVRTANKKFAEEISKWVFHERGHLKAGSLNHHKKGEEVEPSIYRIGDQVEFSVEVKEWSGKEWVPYKADDVQVQFFMMSPYVLKTLSHDGKGKFFTDIHVPDVYGVFQFKVEYKRLGYTTLSLAKQIPVRPFRHDEYERFIGSAFPYYASSFSMMVGFFLFGFVFLYHK